MKKSKKAPNQQLEKFSTILTQLALVLVLFVVFLFLEHESENQIVTPQIGVFNVESDWTVIKPPLIVKKYKVVAERIPKKTVVISNKIDRSNYNEVQPFEVGITSPKESSPDDFLNNIITMPEEFIDHAEDPKPVSINSVQKAPVFKGCEGLSEIENRKCFEKKMKQLVERNFNKELANEVGLASGKKKIFAQFVIDVKGVVTDVQIRAPHPRLKKETSRIIQKIPKFSPGEQNNKKVQVKYVLPITFMVE